MARVRKIVDKNFRDAVEDYVTFRRGRGLAKSTVSNEANSLRALVEFIYRHRRADARIWTHMVTEDMISAYFAEKLETPSRHTGEPLRPQSLNPQRIAFDGFFGWAARRRYLWAEDNPMAEIKAFKKKAVRKQRIDPRDVPRLLDAAEHPRDRILMAVAAFTALRACDIRELRIRQVDLEDQSLRGVLIDKSEVVDEIKAFGPELAEELERWFAWLKGNLGVDELDGTWYLIPGFARRRSERAYRDGGGRWVSIKDPDASVKPTGQFYDPEDVVKAACERIGYDTSDGRWGMHVLRRVMADLLEDQLTEDGIPDARKVVSKHLNHANEATTDGYMDESRGLKARNAILRAHVFFGRTPAVPDPTPVEAPQTDELAARRARRTA